MEMEYSHGMLPLQGIRVIEIAQNLAGPYCGEILAHLGADVIKVERTEGGDDTRGWGPPFLDGAGSSFHAVNLNKRSVAIDLKDAAGKARLLELIDRADVLVQNLRPGSMEALGPGCARAGEEESQAGLLLAAGRSAASARSGTTRASTRWCRRSPA